MLCLEIIPAISARKISLFYVARIMTPSSLFVNVIFYVFYVKNNKKSNILTGYIASIWKKVHIFLLF